jgi:hypothetical protein
MIDIKVPSNVFRTDAISKASGNGFPVNAEPMQMVAITFVSQISSLY